MARKDFRYVGLPKKLVDRVDDYLKLFEKYEETPKFRDRTHFVEVAISNLIKEEGPNFSKRVNLKRIGYQQALVRK